MYKITSEEYENARILTAKYIRQQRVSNHSICSKCGYKISKADPPQHIVMELERGGGARGEFYHKVKLPKWCELTDHPALTNESDVYKIVADIRYENDYRLCHNCTSLFLDLVSDFLLEDGIEPSQIEVLDYDNEIKDKEYNESQRNKG